MTDTPRYLKAFWVTFDNGQTGCVQAHDEKEAGEVGQRERGHVVAKVQSLPYPATPRINPEGRGGDNTPSFCYRPKECAGRTSCPHRRSCVD